MAATWSSTNGQVSLFSQVTLGATARSSLIVGWYYPTALTATRRLFGAGAIWGAEVDTTTDELRLRTDNTTDGQWTTTGVDMVVNEWKFIAIMNSTLNTGPAGAWRVWVGTAESAPVEATVSVATSPVGNFTGNSTLYIGNTASGSTAWEGDIENVFVVASSATIGVTSSLFNQAAYGAITTDAAEFTLRNYVLPLWLGQIPYNLGPTLASFGAYCPLTGGVVSSAQIWSTMDRGTATTTRAAATSVLNVTASERSGPRAQFVTQVGSPQPVRR